MVKAQANEKPRTPVCLGRITGVHGVRGLVTVQTFTETPADICAYGPVRTSSGRELELMVKSAKKAGLIVAVSGVASREAAAALKGEELFTTRERLPQTGAQEWYLADLVGLAALDQAGGSLGTVIAVENFGAGDLLEIAPEDGASVYLPFTREFVPQVDVGAGHMVLAPPLGVFEAADDADQSNDTGETP